MRAFLPISLFLFMLPLEASTILVKSPLSNGLDYKATLKAHAELLSPTQNYLDGHPQMQLREALLTAFADAQHSFLENPDTEARAKFSAVLAYLSQDDWAKSDREIFLLGYLRLAQLESDNGARDHWLELSLLLGKGLSYDSSLFPPPLLARRLELERQFPRRTISRSAFAAGWSQVLINGVLCTQQDCGTWPRLTVPVRVTFVSDQYLPQSQTVDLLNVEHLKPRQIPWIEGACNQTRWHEVAEQFVHKKAFWSLACDKPTAIAQADVLNFQPVQNSAPTPNALPPLALTAKNKAFYEKGWFWVGVGTVVTVGLIASAQKKETRQPTTTYGY